MLAAKLEDSFATIFRQVAMNRFEHGYHNARRATGELTVWNTTQNPHIVRFPTSLVLGLSEDKIRVIAPEVGGGFGSKIAAYPADFLTMFCSRKLGRPVKGTETRSENYQSTTHGRDHVQQVELAAKQERHAYGGVVVGTRDVAAQVDHDHQRRSNSQRGERHALNDRQASDEHKKKSTSRFSGEFGHL